MYIYALKRRYDVLYDAYTSSQNSGSDVSCTNYVHNYVCALEKVCTVQYTHTYIYTLFWEHTHTYIHTYIYIYIYIYVCMYECVPRTVIVM